ncbi:MAG: sulfite exporter TauE/SafE family protein [Candidatus Micrarchaeota archaeon]
MTTSNSFDFFSFSLFFLGCYFMRVRNINNLRLMIIGAFTGFLSALLGVGGGFILIPMLVIYAGYRMVSVAKISLLVTLSIASMAVLANYLANHAGIDFQVAAWVALGALPGSWLGTRLAHSLDHKALVKIFSILLFFIGIKMFGLVSFALPLSIPHESFSYALLGIFAGFLSGLFGIGGGVILVPAFNIVFGFDSHIAISTSLASIIPIALFSLFFHRKGNWPAGSDLKKIIPAAVLGSAVGVVVSTNMQSAMLEILFGVVLVIYSARLFIRTPKAEN